MYEYVIQGWYGPRSRWEVVSSYEDTPEGKAAAYEDYEAYEVNEPQYQHRIRRRRGAA